MVLNDGSATLLRAPGYCMNMTITHFQGLGVYRHDGNGYLIEIKLRDVRQLFNTLDPSPFHEKDLDPAAEDYLVSAARELGGRPSKLLVHVPGPAAAEEASALRSAIANYFAYRARHTNQQLGLMLRRGVISFGIGLLFLFVCLWGRQWIRDDSGGRSVLSEGLLILGWVAMWRPVETFLYDWWPELGKRLLFDRIACMPIEIQYNSRRSNGALDTLEAAPPRDISHHAAEQPLGSPSVTPFAL